MPTHSANPGKPRKSGQSQPAQSQPAHSQPAHSQPAQSKPAEGKPARIQPANDLPAGLSQPALRALAAAGLTTLAEVADHGEAAVASLHGMGPAGVAILRAALAAHGLTFRA